MVVEYLRANTIINVVHYCNFMTECDNNVLKWEYFLDDLNNGEWADHIAIQGLSDILLVHRILMLLNYVLVIVKVLVL